MAKTVTRRQHLESGAKYSGSSIALAVALVGIVTFFKPGWEPISQYMVALSTFVINLIMVYLLKTK